MKAQGIENSITKQADDPSSFIKSVRPNVGDGSVEKKKASQRLMDFPTALRIQALALAEASISYDRIREITGMEAKLLEKMRKTARERGYDPTTSMHMKEEYVADPVNKLQGRPKKRRVDGELGNGPEQSASNPSVPGYAQADTRNLPPGTWNFMAAPRVHSGSAFG
jgi:hypothetical protein